MLLPDSGDDWVGLTDDPLPVGAAADWAVRPDCGAVVVFSGTVRDHSAGRPGVDHLVYEAYDEHATTRLQAISDQARRRWPGLGRVAVIHRTGQLSVGESSVVVAVSAPHRDDAFAAARFCIDAVKATVPIWKRETWAEGESWGLDGSELVEAGRLATGQSEAGPTQPGSSNGGRVGPERLGDQP
ncbi:hypothetical protein BH18ACT4_BH18ACT4_07210 [soil metagenome]